SLHDQHLPVYHRDLKPGNILIWTANTNTPPSEGVPKITDFGLCQGTKLYRSPEVIRGCPVSSAGPDIWAFGVILYELLTGKRPFDNETEIRDRHCPEKLEQRLRDLRDQI